MVTLLLPLLHLPQVAAPSEGPCMPFINPRPSPPNSRSYRVVRGSPGPMHEPSRRAGGRPPLPARRATSPRPTAAPQTYGRTLSRLVSGWGGDGSQWRAGISDAGLGPEEAAAFMVHGLGGEFGGGRGNRLTKNPPALPSTHFSSISCQARRAAPARPASSPSCAGTTLTASGGNRVRRWCISSCRGA